MGSNSAYSIAANRVFPTLISFLAVAYAAYSNAHLVFPSLAVAPTPSGGEGPPASSGPAGPATPFDVDGVSFSPQIKIAGSKQRFVGGGTRLKFGAVKVYTVGIYGDAKALGRPEKHYRGVSAPSKADGASAPTLSDEGAFLVDFATGRHAKTLHLRFRRGVSASDLTEALGDALRPTIGMEKSRTFSDFLLDAIGGGVGGGAGDARVEKGSDLYVTCKEHKLTASTTGEAKAKDSQTIAMEGLCSAVFSIYLGDRPVSPQAKRGFVDGFANMRKL